MAWSVCRECGTSDRRRMIALMAPLFGPFVELPPARGYFHLCPACFEDLIEPHLAEIEEKVAEMHPATFRRREAPDSGAEPGKGPRPGADEGGAQADGEPDA